MSNDYFDNDYDAQEDFDEYYDDQLYGMGLKLPTIYLRTTTKAK
jgi:hypothetical protein